MARKKLGEHKQKLTNALRGILALFWEQKDKPTARITGLLEQVAQPRSLDEGAGDGDRNAPGVASGGSQNEMDEAAVADMMGQRWSAIRRSPEEEHVLPIILMCVASPG
eukprot:CAMPEP_0119126432 /NCGR_PEP_ID=MMETSP1310-20130426/5360_1 /TAXON_ID=464262 /ORGANISM="Genus nov. species nov., Strain RCC2339" /LENGTH=108 /DNA_ID=CAMNT_0007116593 /DNA_START=388 /DNA_END=711 /DNA_ORIENTATION=-